jgi:hypothetical protein
MASCCIQRYLDRFPNCFPFSIGPDKTAPRQTNFLPSSGQAMDRAGRIYIDPVYRKDEMDQSADVSRTMFERITQQDILVVHADADQLIVLFHERVGPNLSVKLARLR